MFKLFNNSNKVNPLGSHSEGAHSAQGKPSQLKINKGKGKSVDHGPVAGLKNLHRSEEDNAEQASNNNSLVLHQGERHNETRRPALNNLFNSKKNNVGNSNLYGPNLGNTNSYGGMGNQMQSMLNQSLQDMQGIQNIVYQGTEASKTASQIVRDSAKA